MTAAKRPAATHAIPASPLCHRQRINLACSSQHLKRQRLTSSYSVYPADRHRARGSTVCRDLSRLTKSRSRQRNQHALHRDIYVMQYKLRVVTSYAVCSRRSSSSVLSSCTRRPVNNSNSPCPSEYRSLFADSDSPLSCSEAMLLKRAFNLRVRLVGPVQPARSL